MSRFPLHDLSDTEFEELVVLICRELMGIARPSPPPSTVNMISVTILVW